MKTSASHSITLRLKIDNKKGGRLAAITQAIAKIGGDIGAIDIVKVEGTELIRDITINTSGETQIHEVRKKINEIDGVKVMQYSDRTFLIHLGGKIEVVSKRPLKTRDDLSMAYTPGVARVCMAIAEDVELSKKLTIRKNTVAVVSDGTAVLGLGDIGPEAALPVMEGKAMLFKNFADVDAFPICVATKNADEIVALVKNLEPTFGGVNLEDISAPRCFEIEEKLKQELNIPVFHDDQHGTAVVMVAAFLNAMKLTKKKIEKVKIIVAGVGAAGTACTKMLLSLGVKNIIGLDRQGALYLGRENMNQAKQDYAAITNPDSEKGTISEVIQNADVFIGLSGPGILTVEDLKKMNKGPIVFAMSNPIPEIMPEQAMPYVSVMATGRSDYPNQINNVLCFPGIFRGALDSRAKSINEAMKMAAARAIADCIPDEALCEDYIIPSVFDKKVAKRVAQAVADSAKDN